MPSLKVSLSPAQIAALHSAALRAGRSDADFARVAITAAIFQAPASQDVQTFDGETPGRAVVAAVLSPTLRNAIAELAKAESRSTSNVTRLLLREALHAREIMRMSAESIPQ